MRLICINNHDQKKKQFLAKNWHSDTLCMCLDIHAQFCGEKPRLNGLKKGIFIYKPERFFFSKTNEHNYD